MIERIALGSREPTELCVEYLLKKLGSEFKHIQALPSLASLLTCVVCTVTPETGEHTLLEYQYGEEQCRGQLHYQHKLKPLLLFLSHENGLFYLIGGMPSAHYQTLLAERYFITYGDLNFDQLWSFFDDQKLLSMMPAIHCREFPDIDCSEMAMMVHQYYCHLEAGVAQQWSEEVHPMANKYLLVLCSASPRLSELVVPYLVNSFNEKLERLKHNPLLLLVFVQKWLKIEMGVTFISDYQEFQSQHSACERAYAAHFDAAQTCPVFVFTVRFSQAIWHLPGNVCELCGRLDCYRSPAEVGKISLADFYLRRVAVTAYQSYLHRKLIELARTLGTRGAIDIWTRLTMKKTEDDHKQFWFSKQEMERIYLEYHNATKAHRKKQINDQHLQTYLSNSAVKYRANFKVDDYYDAVVGEVLFLVWNELREREPVDRCTAALPKGGGPAKPAFSYSFESQTAIDEFITQHWPLCMQNLYFQCHGDRHLVNSERTRVSRFILDCRYEPQFARQLWRNFFINTVVGDCTEELFWKGEYGIHFLYQEKATKRNLFPSCGRMLESNHCPHGDIEDVAQSTCLRLGNESRAKLGKAPRHTWKIYGPMSYALMTQEN